MPLVDCGSGVVDSLLVDQATVAYGYSVGPSWGHDGRYNGYNGASRDDGEGSRGVGSCCLLMGTRCGFVERVLR